MSSTPLIESPDQTPEQGDSVPLLTAEVSHVLEQMFDTRKQACATACENVHQHHGSRTAEPYSVYYELVEDAHRQGFGSQDVAVDGLRRHTP